MRSQGDYVKYVDGEQALKSRRTDIQGKPVPIRQSVQLDRGE
jgi:hypothetical protein